MIGAHRSGTSHGHRSLGRLILVLELLSELQMQMQMEYYSDQPSRLWKEIPLFHLPVDPE